MTPTTRLSTSASVMVAVAQSGSKLGMTLSPAGTAINLSTKSNNVGIIVYTGLTNFQTSYSSADVKTYSTSTTVNPQPSGFAFNTIK